jgi:hypothetical protein
MIIERKNEFDSVAQRCLWGYCFAYSDFAPVNSDMADENAQKTLHEWMEQLLKKLYENPGLLDLPRDADEAFEWYICNNQKPELNVVYLKIFKILFEFYQFIFAITSFGNIMDRSLLVNISDLKKGKSAFKPAYQKILSEVGVSITKNKTEITIIHENGISLFNAMKLLTQSNSLFNFVRCSFDGKFDYLLPRIDNLCQYDGLLLELDKECLARGYQKGLHLGFGPTNFCIRLDYNISVGGFALEYNPRKRIQFSFATQNGIGVKAMLMDFDKLSPHVQKFLLNVCRRCTHCHGCTHGGKIKGAKDQNVDVMYQDEEIAFCSLFPDFWQERYDRERIDSLFEYHDLQNKYQPSK